MSVEAARYYLFSFHLPVLYLPSKIINADNKEKKQRKAKQTETTTIVPLGGMKEIKDREEKICLESEGGGGGETCYCAQAAADKGLQEPKTGHIQNISVEED